MLDTIHQALDNLLAAKLRSFLAILGILVGTASVVALVSSGELATQKALEQFKALGTDMLAMSLYEEKPSSSNTPANTLNYNETILMAKVIDGVRQVAPYAMLYVPITFRGRSLQGSVIATTENLKQSIKIHMEPGSSFISFLDRFAHYAVIGSNIATKIKTQTHNKPIGQQIWLGDTLFTIIGVAKPWTENSFFYANVNDSIFIPIQASALLSKNAKIGDVVLILDEKADIDTIENKIEHYVKNNAPQLKIFFRSAKQLIEGMKSQQGIFTLLLGFIGGISLLVGGIGVMNIMLVSVSERRREIGIRKAIGARRKDIQRLFLWEAIVLALFGGCCGVVLGIIISFVTAHYADWGFHLLLTPPLIGFIVSTATGIFFGYYPAYRAARLDPITALRYE